MGGFNERFPRATGIRPAWTARLQLIDAEKNRTALPPALPSTLPAGGSRTAATRPYRHQVDEGDCMTALTEPKKSRPERTARSVPSIVLYWRFYSKPMVATQWMRRRSLSTLHSFYSATDWLLNRHGPVAGNVDRAAGRGLGNAG